MKTTKISFIQRLAAQKTCITCKLISLCVPANLLCCSHLRRVAQFVYVCLLTFVRLDDDDVFIYRKFCWLFQPCSGAAYFPNVVCVLCQFVSFFLLYILCTCVGCLQLGWVWRPSRSAFKQIEIAQRIRTCLPPCHAHFFLQCQKHSCYSNTTRSYFEIGSQGRRNQNSNQVT